MYKLYSEPFTYRSAAYDFGMQPAQSNNAILFSELVSNSEAFSFGMFDIGRIRNDMRDLIEKLSKLYWLRKTERDKKLKDAKQQQMLSVESAKKMKENISVNIEAPISLSLKTLSTEGSSQDVEILEQNPDSVAAAASSVAVAELNSQADKMKLVQESEPGPSSDEKSKVTDVEQVSNPLRGDSSPSALRRRTSDTSARDNSADCESI
jgi:hypothetical protein